MSFSSARRVRAALLPLALATVAAGSLPASAAPHTAPACSSAGVSITAYGSTFETNAQASFIAGYGSACGAGAASVTYNNPLGTGAGSGKCIDLVVNHTPDAGYGYTPYCGSDDALTTQQWATANSTGGAVNQVPVAIGAVTVSFNAGASGCSALVLTSAQISGIFSGQITNFTQLGCGNQPITRVVRNAVSGTTCIFKTYLAKRNVGDPTNSWQALNATTGCGSTAWPGTPVTANGNSGIAAYISANAGAVGYVELSAAVSAGLHYANVKTAAEEAPGGSSENPDTGSRANCSDTGAAIPPHTSSSGWDAVSLSDGATGYPICGYAYAFVYTSNPYGGNVTQAQIDAAVDLLLVANGTNPGRYYAPIGAHASAVARAGLATIL
jgi:ABC-type phosphate transport system substrate-binding protein